MAQTQLQRKQAERFQQQSDMPFADGEVAVLMWVDAMGKLHREMVVLEQFMDEEICKAKGTLLWRDTGGRVDKRKPYIALHSVGYEGVTV